MAATEVFANNPSTTVISGGTDAPASGTTEVWTVASNFGWPTASTGSTQFHVGDPAAPSEVILVTNMSGTTWNVTRGAESSVPVAHSANFTIAQVVTAGWLGSVSFVNPMTSPGDMVAGTTSGLAVRVPGNTGSTKEFLTSTGAAGTAQTPVWGTISASDVPTLNQNTSGTAANVSGTVTTSHGGTGLASLATYAVLTGGTSSTSPVQQVAGAGTAGQVLTSNGAGALPSWQAASGGTVTFPITVTEGGTGGTTATAYSVVTGGTAATTPLQQVASVGSSGQVLTSQGAGKLPTWTNSSGYPPADWINVQNPLYGATGNAVNSYNSGGTADGLVNSGSHTFTSHSLVPFTGSRSIWIPGAGSGGNTLVTTITCTVAGTGTLAGTASTSVSGALATWGTDDTTAIQAAIAAATENQSTAEPTGMTVYFPAGIYLTSAPLIVPPCVTLLGSGRSLAYYSGSLTMQLSGPILKPVSGFTPVTINGGTIGATPGGTVSGVIGMVSQNLGGYPGGSSNQMIRNITIDGRLLNPAGTIRGIEAWGPVWGAKLEDVGIYGVSDYGIYTSSSTADGTGKLPDFWQVIGCHIAACHNDGLNTNSWSDTYIALSESTGNSGNGWTITGADNVKIVGCKAEYNTGTGLSIGRGGAGRPILVSGFGTDGNYQGGISVTGSGYGPVNITGCGLNFDGQNNGAGGNTFSALSVTGNGHVTATGLQVTSGTIGTGGTAYPWNGVYVPSTFTGVLQLDNCEIYAGGTPISVAPSATGTVITGPNVLTGTGSWPGESVTQVWEPAASPGGGFGSWQPSDHNLTAWTFDPALCTSQTVVTSGTQYLSGLYVSQFTTFSNIYWSVGTAPGTVTANQNFIGVVQPNGHLLNASPAGAIDSVLTSTGLKTTAVAGTVSPGFYWVVMLFNYTGTSLQIGRGASFETSVPNVGLSASSYRYATCGATKTDLSNFPITTSSNALSATAFWTAIG